MKLQSSFTCTTITAKDSECPGGKKEAKSEKKKKKKNRAFATRLCLLITSEATTTMSHQRDCLNLRLAR